MQEQTSCFSALLVLLLLWMWFSQTRHVCGVVFFSMEKSSIAIPYQIHKTFKTQFVVEQISAKFKKKKWMNFVVQVLYYNNDWLFWLIPNRNFHGRCKVGPWKQMILKSKTWYLWLLVVPNCENQPLTLGQTNLCMVPRLYIRSNQPFTSNLRSSSFQSTTMAHGIRSSAL